MFKITCLLTLLFGVGKTNWFFTSTSEKLALKSAMIKVWNLFGGKSPIEEFNKNTK